MTAAGVDACPTGWVAVVLGAEVRTLVGRRFADVLAACADAAAIGVDIPVGVPERGRRPADAAARAFVRPAGSTVFPTPVRAALLAPTFAEACARSRELAGCGLSRQSWGMRRRILEVEAAGERRVVEVHPEVSFRVLAGRPLPRKRTPEGAAARRALLAAEGIAPARSVAGAAEDDVLDAAVAAWSARRRASGTARPFPDPPDPGGTIWA